MRKIDKKINILKANLLVEQRYLESKGFEVEPKKGDEIIWIAPPKKVANLSWVMTGAKGEYLGREGGEEVVSFYGYNFYTSRGTFELADQEPIKEQSNGFNSVRLINKNDFKAFISSNPALFSTYDNENNKYKIYLNTDLVGYFNPKLGRIDYEENSRFAKISDEFTWDRNINEFKDNDSLHEEELPFKTYEGESLKVGENYIYVGRVAKDPRTIVTDEDDVKNINVSLTKCLSYACYFKVLDQEFIDRGFTNITINNLEKISKFIHNT